MTAPRPDRTPRWDATAGGVARTVTTVEDDLARNLKFFGGAAVLGLLLAGATAVALERWSAPPGSDATAAVAAPEVAPQPALEIEAMDATDATDEAPEPELEEAQEIFVLATALAPLASEVGRIAESVPVPEPPPEPPAVIAPSEPEPVAEEEPVEAEIEAEEAAHAASGDDIVDLDKPDAPIARAPVVRERTSEAPTKKKSDKEPKQEKKAVAKDAPAEEAPEKPAGPAGEFSRDAARSAMFAAAGSVSGCGGAGGPSGRGKASVTLGSNGRATSVSVSAPFAGTKVGSCIAGIFRSVSVPPFTGGAVTLEKSFNVAAPAATNDTPKEASAEAKPDAPEKKGKRSSKRVKKRKKKKTGD